MKSRRRRAAAGLAAAALIAVAATGCGAGRAAPPGPGSQATLQLNKLRTSLEQQGPISLPATPAPSGQGVGAANMTQFVKVVIENVNQFWADTFAGAGLSYSGTRYVILDAGAAPEQSACQGQPAAPDNGPFYCGFGGQLPGGQTTSDPVIYVGDPWLSDQMSGVGQGNYDFAVASVVAHEFGHHVQEQLLRSGGLSPDALPGKFRELSADCLGGVWANSAYRNGELDDGDVAEAMTAAWDAGSDLPDDTGPDPHGTRQERLDAFTLGYTAGDPTQCLQVTPA